jgi:thiamine biosynthesis lipoprotein
MGTWVSIEVHDVAGDRARASAVVERAFNEVRAVDELMSVFRPESQISRINRSAGRDPIVVDRRVAEVLRAAHHTGERSEGVFDVTVLPLLRALGLRSDRPEPGVAAAALARVDYRTVEVDPLRPQVGLSRAGAAIDLGGIAKGYAVDRAIAVLQDAGIGRAVVNAGGDLRVLGVPGDRDHEGWRVGVQHPLRPGRILATLELRDQAIATSGNYEQFIAAGEERPGHLIDPRTGGPVDHLMSATVVASTAMEADAASTTAYLLGGEQGARYLSERAGYEHLFVDRVSGRTPKVSASRIAAESALDLIIHHSPGIRGLSMAPPRNGP